jgi:hypothetical protein
VFYRSALILLASLFLSTTAVFPHCDREDGPVVADGRSALASGSIDGALKWVGPEQEGELKNAFALASSVRRGGADARKLADRWFLESLVRLHREFEGEAYAGIKTSEVPLPPAIVHADRALEEGELGNLAQHIGGAASTGVEARFQRALDAKKRMGENVEAGRAFTAAYAEYVRYVEILDAAIRADAHAH